MEPKELAIVLESLSVTRKQLAIALEVHPVTIWRWERGKTAIPKYVARELNRLCAEKA